MGKKVKTQKVQAQQAQEGSMAKKVESQEVQAQQAPNDQENKTARHAVKATEFLRALNLEWVLERPLEPGDIDILKAQVTRDVVGTEWAGWWIPYRKADGTPVPGISWGVSVPVGGGILILRLVEDRETKATLKVWPTGKGVLSGSPEIVMALASRPDLPRWSDADTASLL